MGTTRVSATSKSFPDSLSACHFHSPSSIPLSCSSAVRLLPLAFSRVSGPGSVSPFPLNQFRLSSLSKTSTAPSLQDFCERSRPLNPKKGFMLSPLLQIHIGILPVCWVSNNLQPRPCYDAHHVPLRISCYRIYVFHQVSHDSLEIAWSHLPFRSPYSFSILFDPSMTVETLLSIVLLPMAF